MFMKTKKLKHIMYVCSTLSSIAFSSESNGMTLEKDGDKYTPMPLSVRKKLEGPNHPASRKKNSGPRKDWTPGNPQGSIQKRNSEEKKPALENKKRETKKSYALKCMQHIPGSSSTVPFYTDKERNEWVEGRRIDAEGSVPYSSPLK